MSNNIIYDAMAARYPRNNSKGEHSLNCPACIHNGETPDRRKRGSFRLKGQKLLYNCFNCHYAVIYETGGGLTRKMERLLGWMGISSDEIRRLGLRTWLIQKANPGPPRLPLPDGLQSINDWLNANCLDPRFLEVAEFIASMNDPQMLNDTYWTDDDNGLNLSDYAVNIRGSLSYPTGWLGYPVIDRNAPYLDQDGDVEEPDDDLTPEQLKELREQYELHKDDDD